ncbi:MAG: Fpg/Nei family DNA glycosylase [Rhodothermales bacterium]
MPEGPEVRRYADALSDALVGARVVQLATRIRTAKAWLADHPDAFEGRHIERIRSHGKHLIGHTDEGAFFHVHLMMWGRWQIVAPDDPLVLERDRRERARIITPDVAALLMSAPMFNVGLGDPYAEVPILATLGPDVLPEEGPFDVAGFRTRLADHAGRTVGAVLLDQTLVAGIGNYLRAEILYACRIDPWRKVADLSEADVACLAITIPDLSARAYRTGGRTVDDTDYQRLQTDADLVYQPDRAWETRHYVFRRTNLPCLRCGDTIRQKRQVTRRTDDEEKTRIIYFCPTCQSTSVPLPKLNKTV